MSKKVLIIDDNPTDAGMVKSILVEEGLEVDVAVTGEEGMRKAIEIKPDLIVLDLILPDISGLDVCYELKKNPGLYNTKIVILSIKDDISYIKKAFDARADDYVIKPAMPEFLARKVKLYLGLK